VDGTFAGSRQVTGIIIIVVVVVVIIIIIIINFVELSVSAT
jgi:hypothetical protein